MDESLFTRLERALTRGSSKWSLTLEGEDPRAFLWDLIKGLRGNADGSGKKIDSKLRYVGLGPTLAWLLASRDPSYTLMHDSIESFARLWQACEPALGGSGYHYVSLGVGTGDKDRHVMRDLTQRQPSLVYVAVDISAHMLRLGSVEAMRTWPNQVLPIELDFEARSSLDELRALLDELVGDEAVLFSLLGNTVANIEDDQAFLRHLRRVLRPQDRLVLEVATTDRLTALATELAADERAGSRSYSEFATAALATYTDLTIDTNWLTFKGSIENGRAVRVEGHYVNRGGVDIPMMMPNRVTIPFRADESIQVLLSRKYSANFVREMVAGCGFAELAFEYSASGPAQSDMDDPSFGLSIMVLRRDDNPQPVASPLGRVWAPTPIGSRAHQR